MKKIYSRTLIVFLTLLFPVASIAASQSMRMSVADAFAEDRLALKAMSYDFIKLLEERRFDELDKQLEALQIKYEQGANEWAVLESFEQFSSRDERHGPLFDEWVKHNKGHWTARLARGVYRVALGWEKRGKKYIDETSNRNIQEMTEQFWLARKDLKLALEQKPLVIIAYKMLLQVANGLGEEEEENRLIEDALNLAPHTYYLRWQYIYGMQPKWGGSIPIVNEFARESQKARKNNPRVYALLGFKHAIKASQLKRKKKYNEAAEAYSKALEFGPLTSWLRSRAYCYKKLKRYDDQIVDLNEILDKSPEDTGALGRRGYAYVKKKNYPAALSDLERAIQLGSRKGYVSNNIGWIHYQQGRSEKAAEYFDLTLKNNADNLYALKYCGISRARLRQYDKAEKCLERAVKLAPQDATAWRNYGDALHAQGKPGDLEALANYLKYADRKKEKNMYNKVREYLVNKDYKLPENVK